MNPKLKKSIIVLVAVIAVICIVGILINLFPHKKISLSDVKEVKMHYRYSDEEKDIDPDSLNDIVNTFNSCNEYDKVYSEELPCFSITLKLKGGVELNFIDLHSDDSILVERSSFGNTTKYELYDEDLLHMLKKLIEDNFGLHKNQVCAKNQ